MSLNNPWQIAWKGLTMGDGTPYVVQSVTGLHDTPGVRTSDMDRARRHGAFPGSDYTESRVVVAEILVDGRHPNEAVWSAFSLAHVVGDEVETPLSFRVPGVAGGIEVVVFAKCRRLNLPTDRDYAAGIGTATVQWTATDPRIYSADEVVLFTAMATVAGTGRTYPLTYPRTYGGPISGGFITATNEGEFPSPWVAVIDGPVEHPRIENVGTGQTIAFNGTVAAGSSLVVDSDNRTVMLDGASRYHWLAPGSQWFDVLPGANTVRLAGLSGAGSLTFTYRHAWI